MHADWDVQVNINWQELRILTMWAERWMIHACEQGWEGAPTCLEVVRAIAARLGAQHPALPALTFIGEVEEMREMFGHDNVQQNVVREKPLPDDDRA